MKMHESIAERARVEPPMGPTDLPKVQLGEFTQWSLVSADGRANLRLRDGMVVGAGECCDLRLQEEGIALHHALVSVESAQLYVTPLSASPTHVDGQPLRGRQRVSDRATLSIGAASFKVLCDEDRVSAVHAGFREDIAGTARRSPPDVPRAPEVHAGFREDMFGAPAFGTPARQSPIDAPHASDASASEVHSGFRDDIFGARQSRRATRRRRHRKAIVGTFVAALVLAALVIWFAPPRWLDLTAGTSPASVALDALTPQKVSPTLDVPSTAVPAPDTRGLLAAETPESAAIAPREPPVADTATAALHEPPAAETKPSVAEPEPSAAETAAAATSETPAAAPADDRASNAMAVADDLYSRGALITPRGQNAATAYVKVLSIAPNDKVAKQKLTGIVSQVAADSQQLILHQRFSEARQKIDRLASAIPNNARQFVAADALDRWHVVDLLLRADAMMQKYQIVEPEHDNAVALLREALRIDPKNPVGDDMLAKAYGMLSEAQRKAIGEGPTTGAVTSG